MAKKINLSEIVSLPNIVEFKGDAERSKFKLPKEKLDRLSRLVLDGLEIDKKSRSEWDLQIKEVLNLVNLVSQEKIRGGVKVANIKYPLTRVAATQFAARMFPEFVRGGKAVECKVSGKDLQGLKASRARRVSEFMSWQLLIEDPSWEQHFDKLLNMLPIYGTLFKKTWYDPIQEKNRSELFLPEDIIVNNNIKSLDTARRVSHLFTFNKNDLLERMRAGIFTDIPLEELSPDNNLSEDTDLKYGLVEQQRWFDLDDDDYEEPYYVTAHINSGKILRLSAAYNSEDIRTNFDGEVVQISPQQVYTDYHFIPSSDGGFYSIGFGVLLLALNDTLNTILSQLVDAGRLATSSTGFFGKGFKLPNKNIEIQEGKYIQVDALGEDIRKNIVDLNFKEPSPVLLQLVEILIGAAKEVASVTDSLQGTEKAQNTSPTTVLALIKQGLITFSAIQRRLYRSMKKEFEKLFKLNRLFLSQEKYATVLDDPAANVELDFGEKSLDINPVSDPSLSSDAERIGKVQFLLSLVGQPGINSEEIYMRLFDALQAPNPEKLLLPKSTEPTLAERKVESEIEINARKLELAEQELKLSKEKFLVDIEKAQATIINLKAQAVQSIANAEAAEAGIQLDSYVAQMDALKEKISPSTTETSGPKQASAQQESPMEMAPDMQQTGQANLPQPQPSMLGGINGTG